MRDNNSRAAATRSHWLETLDRYMQDRDVPGSADYWSPRLDTASRDEITAIQDAKVGAVVPFLYENSGFYRRRFERLGLIPDDIKCAADLIAKWPVVEKTEMAMDAAEHPPYEHYTTIDDTVWAERGWMMFASSGSTGVPRVFRYSHVDREMGAWANARALHSMNSAAQGDTVFVVPGYGPHVWAWGVQYALEKMRLPVIPGGGMDARARANIVQRFKPTILLLTPSYALHLARIMQSMGGNPRESSVRTLFVAGEPGMSVAATRERIQDLWGARMVEFYGCTEASPHVGGVFLPGFAAAGRAGHDASHGGCADVGSRRCREQSTTTRRPARPHGLHKFEQRSLATTAFPGRRLHDTQPRTLSLRSHACTGHRFVFWARRRFDQSARIFKMFPIQIEEAVRAIEGTGDEFEIVLATNADGLDIIQYA